MTDTLPNSVLQELAARLEFYRELGIYDFYRRDAADPAAILSATANMGLEETQPPVPRKLHSAHSFASIAQAYS